MKKSYFLIFIIVTLLNCYPVPDSIPVGESRYKLFVNGIEVGSAIVSNRIEDGKYISSAEYTMKLMDMNAITRDTVVETLDFKPLKLESYSKVEYDGEIYETNIVSVFSGRAVELIHNGEKYNYTINRDFILDGNYFIDKLIKGKFRKGFEISNYIYNPSVELETPIKATTKVIGFINVIINGDKQRLIHVVQSVENIEDNIDLFIDSRGDLRKGIIHMLNLKIELIKI
jgi:hypothetical protein